MGCGRSMYDNRLDEEDGERLRKQKPSYFITGCKVNGDWVEESFTEKNSLIKYINDEDWQQKPTVIQGRLLKLKLTIE